MEWWMVPVGIAAVAFGGLALLFAWPLILCWYLGYPAVGVLAEVIYLVAVVR